MILSIEIKSIILIMYLSHTNLILIFEFKRLKKIINFFNYQNNIKTTNIYIKKNHLFESKKERKSTFGVHDSSKY
jgi:hypothetical protein